MVTVFMNSASVKTNYSHKLLLFQLLQTITN